MRAIFSAVRRLACIVTIFGICIGSASATLLFFDEFAYGVSTDLTVASGGNWTATSTQANKIPVLAGTLTYPGLVAGSGNHIELSDARNEDDNRAFTPVTGSGSSVYVSFLLKVTTAKEIAGAANGNPEYFAHFIFGDNFTVGSKFVGRLGIRVDPLDAGKYNLGTGYLNGSSGSNENTVFAPSQLNVGQTYLIVQKITLNAGAQDDQVYLWINPAMLGSTEPAPSVSTANSPSFTGSNPTDGNINVGIKRFALRQANGMGTMEIDEIRVGTTWAEIIPTAAPAGDDPNLSSASSLSFGAVATNQTTDSVLVIHNAGSAQALNITGHSIGGPDGNRFSVISGIPSGNIAPGGSHHVVLRYNPNGQAGLANGALSLASNDQGSPAVNIGLSGIGIAVLPLNEPFEYEAGPLVINSLMNWSPYSSAGQGPSQVLSSASDHGASLKYAGIAAPTGNRLRIRCGSNREDVTRAFADQIFGGPIYSSLLIKVTSLPTSGTSANATPFSFQKTRGSNSLPQGMLGLSQGNDSSKFRLGVSLSSFLDADFTNDLDTNVTYLVVLKYNQIVGANNDTISLYLNPNASSAVEGQGSSQTVMHTNASETDLDETQNEYFSGINISQDNAESITLELDEVRVGLSYSSVLNSTPPRSSAKHWVLLD